MISHISHDMLNDTHIITQNYLQSYAEKHNLMQHIRFGSTVLSMEERFDETKGNNIGWVLQIKSDNESEAYSMEFDYVCVCSGTFTNPKTLYILNNIPDYTTEITT